MLSNLYRKWPHFLAVLTLVVIPPTIASAAKLRVLHQFTGGLDGGEPIGTLVMDAAGNIYGVAPSGGTGNAGLIFELSPSSNGSRETILYNFSGGADGGQPQGGLVADAAGNLFGTTWSGGTGCGVLFELINQSGAWGFQVLHAFINSDGCIPRDPGLVFDSDGNLYGVANSGGTNNVGTVFELSPSGGGAWTFAVIHNFGDANDGYNPAGQLAIAQDDTLYGTTAYGGAFSAGTVFKMAKSEGGWT